MRRANERPTMLRFPSLKIMLLAGAALTVVTGARAQTMEDALSAAYRTNPSLLAQRAALRAVDETVPQALSAWRPTVTLSGSLGKAHDTQRNTTTATNGSGAQSTTVIDRYRTPDLANLSVSQPLYRGGRTLAATSQAENNVQRGRALLHSSEQTVLLDAATAYANLLSQQATVDLNVNNQQVLERQLQATRDRFSVGEVTRTDVAQAEARLEQAKASRIQAEGNLISSRATYEKIIGTPAPSRAAPAPAPANLPGSEGEARNGAANFPDFIAAKFTEKAAADAVDLVLGEKLPTVSLAGSLSRNTEATTRGVQQDQMQVALQVSVPLYQAGEPDARARASKQTASQRRLDTATSQRLAVENALKNYEALNTARARIVSFEAQIRSSQIALEGVEQEARVGLRTVLDVLNAEQDVFSARVNLVTAQRDETVAGYTLASSIGRLTAMDLNLPVAVYDPTKYYNETRGSLFGTTGPSSEDAPSSAGR